MMLVRVALLATGLSCASALRSKGFPEYNDPCPFGYGDNCGSGQIDPSTKAQVGAILEGILKNLEGKKGLVQTTKKVTKGAPVAKDAHTQTPKVKAALQSLVARLQKRSKQDAAVKAISELLTADKPDAACLYFGACGGDNHPIDGATKAEVANILSGILKNL